MRCAGGRKTFSNVKTKKVGKKKKIQHTYLQGGSLAPEYFMKLVARESIIFKAGSLRINM